MVYEDFRRPASSATIRVQINEKALACVEVLNDASTAPFLGSVSAD